MSASLPGSSVPISAGEAEQIRRRGSRGPQGRGGAHSEADHKGELPAP